MKRIRALNPGLGLLLGGQLISQIGDKFYVLACVGNISLLLYASLSWSPKWNILEHVFFGAIAVESDPRHPRFH